MSWAIGFDSNWDRDIGYGVPAWCDHPDCTAEIDRGLSHVCGAGKPYGGDDGCGLYFCSSHLFGLGYCERCSDGRGSQPFEPKPDHPQWVHHKLTDPSWAQWREENPDGDGGKSDWDD